ncbi:MAG: hypothetical protein ABL866_01870 [Devosia sp.]
MKLVKFISPDGPVYINPEHVVAVRKGMKDTKIDTVSGVQIVTETPEVAARLLGADELALDITPALPPMKEI